MGYYDSQKRGKVEFEGRGEVVGRIAEEKRDEGKGNDESHWS
jgi:hypothetical protein